MRTWNKPVDAANNTLITYCASFDVWILGSWWRYGINREARAVRSHVWVLLCFVHCKAIGGITLESHLAEMNQQVSIRMPLPGDGGTNKEVTLPMKSTTTFVRSSVMKWCSTLELEEKKTKSST